jgi:hypothetical protein
MRAIFVDPDAAGVNIVETIATDVDTRVNHIDFETGFGQLSSMNCTRESCPYNQYSAHEATMRKISSSLKMPICSTKEIFYNSRSMSVNRVRSPRPPATKSGAGANARSGSIDACDLRRHRPLHPRSLVYLSNTPSFKPRLHYSLEHNSLEGVRVHSYSILPIPAAAHKHLYTRIHEWIGTLAIAHALNTKERIYRIMDMSSQTVSLEISRTDMSILLQILKVATRQTGSVQ